MVANTTGTSPRDEKSGPGDNQISPPSLSLPKGGGAIRGIGEKFGANPVTGTGSMTVPIAISPARSGFGPQLALSYDSGAGNGPFGFGLHLSLPAITRRTDKGLPQYDDGEESDVFLLSGAEDLVPLLVKAGEQWQRQPTTRTVNGVTYRIQQYRPRLEGLFARIERWTDTQTGEIHWRSISKENVTTLYGRDNNSRIFDPAEAANNGHPQRIFSWLICASFDDKGNAIVYEYKAEDSTNIDQWQANESNRTAPGRSANRYLKRIKYGNLPSRLEQPDLTQMSWMFEVVFDYGEHEADAPTPAEALPWLCRNDPFSSYRSGFEVRTYRLCQRVLMFHHFPNEPTADQDYLVRSTDFVYQNTRNNPDDLRRGNPLASFIASVTQHSYKREADGSYLKKSLPALEFTYSQAVISQAVQEIDADSLENLAAGLDGRTYRWVDLDAEGVSGILTEQAGAWFYKPNLGNGEFGPLEVVAHKPASAALNDGRQQLLSLVGDGRLDLVDFAGPAPGFFKRAGDQQWENFATFPSLPEIAWQNANLRFVDLDSDGLADVLITEDEALVWHQSLAEEGFGPAQYVSKPFDEERGPKLVFADGTQTIYLADMSGDGLSDLVRVRNGEVCYWPNLGYGLFGSKVSMDGSPWFTSTELFDEQRVRLADIDGSGTNDLIYLGSDAIQVYSNQSGNSWSARQTLPPLPHLDRLSSIMTVDLLGNGTACLVWSSPLPGDTRRSLRYIDLMEGQKPHLLISLKNNLGAETSIQYASSTKFYLADKLAGRPWITRLAFPVHVVERVEVDDRISGNRFVTRYAYHHGYYDSFEREFRGFGMVEQRDTEEMAVLTDSGTLPAATNIDATSYVPPVLTRIWYHTGVFIDNTHISRLFEDEYYREGDASKEVAGLTDTQLEAMLLGDSILPTTVRLPDETRLPYDLTGDEAQEACRALKGALLRQEIYSLDGTDAQDRPYSVSEHNYTIELLQPQVPNRHAVFFTHARESIDFHYERTLYDVDGQKLADPRVSHAMTLAVDGFGNVLQTVALAYGRRHDDLDPQLTSEDRDKQRRIMRMYTENEYTNAVQQDDAYRVPTLCDTRTYELIHITPDTNEPQVTNLFRFTELAAKVQTASDGQHDLPYEDIDAVGATTNAPYRRLLSWERVLYRKDDLSAALPLGRMQTLALPFEHYTLAFTPGLLAGVYQRKNGNVTEALLFDPVSMLGNEGGYQRSNDLKAGGSFPASDPDDYWWVPSGQIFYSPDIPNMATDELSYARQHFFVARRYRDPFAETTSITYDAYDLLVQETQDPSGNRTTAGTRDPSGNLVSKSSDYRVLQPALVMDANRNRAAVAFDTLGMVVGTAVMGKPEENQGDTLDGFVPDLADAVIATHLQDPLTDPHSLLQRASTRLVYDLFAYQRTQGDPQPQPPVVYTLARETHDADLAQGQLTKVRHSFSYSDGFGREIQKKAQAEPGSVPRRDANSKIIVGADGQPAMTLNEVNPRWMGSGWTVFNNKGKPVRQYEPFFTDTHRFEFDVRIGVSPVLFYDPVERVVATLHPIHTWEKVVFDPWKQQTYDVNDTVLNADGSTDPRSDKDVKGFFSRLPEADFLPTWYEQRVGLAAHDPERVAAVKAAVHRQTPTVAHLDTLGRTFLTVAHNRFERNGSIVEEQYPTRVELDIEGNQRAVRDAIVQNSDQQGRIVMRYDYNMLGKHIHQASMEAGERWMLNDGSGKPIYAWDSRNHQFRTAYDALRRPTDSFLSEGTGPELLIGRVIYGESQFEPEAKNLRGKVVQVFDQAGTVTSEEYDFKGNLLASMRQLAREYKTSLDWSTSPELEQEIFAGSTTYDALNRPLSVTTPDHSIYRPTFNEANLLERVDVQLHGAQSATSFVTNIDYNAKGQRTLLEYGSNVKTEYRYDPLTLRLTNLTTTRLANQALLQDLSYTYDPRGNITHIQDDAQQTIYFRNRQVEPSADYTYDAVYRLQSAGGREHLGQVGGDGSNLAPVALTYDDSARMGILQPGDGNAMGRYLQQYTYDEVGNILQMLHSGSDPAQSGWTRTYNYNGPSPLEAGKVSNRLSSTTISGSSLETYTYDAHGNMTSMPHLPLMQWSYKDQLQATTRQVVNIGGVPEITYYVYNASGQRVRKVTERQAAQGQTPKRLKERIYAGAFEIYREYGGDGSTIILEREALHVMHDKQRIALVETKTVDNQSAASNPQALIRYQFSNHLGSATLELDEGGQIISYEEYYPYGSTSYQAGRSTTEVSLKRYRYIGMERDEESELAYHTARYYSPWLGRWVSCDPKFLAGGHNLFCYCACSPILCTDGAGTEPKQAGTRHEKASLAEESGREALKKKYSKVDATVDITPPKDVSANGVDTHLIVGSGKGATNVIGDVKYAGPTKTGSLKPEKYTGKEVSGSISSFDNAAKNQYAQLVRNIEGAHQAGLIDDETAFNAIEDARAGLVTHDIVVSGRTTGVSTAIIDKYDAFVTRNDVFAESAAKRESLDISKSLGKNVKLKASAVVGVISVISTSKQAREMSMAMQGYKEDGPLELSDELGNYFLYENCGHLGIVCFPYKKYISGPLTMTGFDRVEIPYEKYIILEGKAEEEWGYTSFWGNFVPGTRGKYWEGTGPNSQRNTDPDFINWDEIN